MVKIAVFGKQECAKCKSTKNKLEHFINRWKLDHTVQLTYHDLETVDGLAEGAFHDVRDIPLTIVENEGRQIARWDGEVPNSQALKLVLEEGADVTAN